MGSNQQRDIDVRIICATNRKLESEVNAGRFREDLYFRLSVVRMELPPLRLRKDDIPLLTVKFLQDFYGSDVMDEVSDFERTMQAFMKHDWPGNVRELRNVVEMASYSERRPLNLGTFLYLGGMKASSEAQAVEEHPADRPFKEAKNELVAAFERSYLHDLLKRSDGNISQAARTADIERAYLQRLIKKYNLK